MKLVMVKVKKVMMMEWIFSFPEVHPHLDDPPYLNHAVFVLQQRRCHVLHQNDDSAANKSIHRDVQTSIFIHSFIHPHKRNHSLETIDHNTKLSFYSSVKTVPFQLFICYC
eukprot:m.110062 g.110062  ORF g.110062 m.110062 type:complete len:111 (+) comp9214_c0_seq1:524-856(+)